MSTLRYRRPTYLFMKLEAYPFFLQNSKKIHVEKPKQNFRNINSSVI